MRFRDTLFIFIVSLVMIGPAGATTITVNSAASGSGDANSCTIQGAFWSAAQRTATGGCPAGDGNDVILLPQDATFTLIAQDSNYDGGLLTTINSVVTVVGNGSILEPASQQCRRFFVVEASGSLYLNNVTLRGGCNSSEGGGAVLANSGFVYITDSEFIENDGGFWPGGAILAYSPASMVIEDSSFENNKTMDRGGAIYNRGASVVIRRSYFAENSAEEGGALGIDGGITLDNSTFSNNSAGYGGAIAGGSDASLISYSTFSGNVADVGSVAWFESGQVTFANNLFLHPVGGGPAFNCEIDPNYATLTFKYTNISDDSSCGSSNVVSSPLQLELGQLGRYEAQTAFYPLEPGSVAIAASNCLAADDLPEYTDQRGTPRPTYQGHCDVGAFESDTTAYPSAPPPSSLGAGNLLISNGDFVSEYTRDGIRLRDFWPSLQAPGVGGVVGVEADGLNAFGIFHGRTLTDFGHYVVSADAWTSVTAPSWNNYYGQASTMITHAGSRWFLTGITNNCQCEIVVFDNSAAVGNLLIGSDISDIKMGQDGMLYVLSGLTVFSYDVASLTLQKSVSLADQAQGFGIGALAVGKQGEMYVYRSDATILKLDSQGSEIASVECVVPFSPAYSCVGAQTMALSADQQLFVLDGNGIYAPAVVLQFDGALINAPTAFSVPTMQNYNGGQFALSPLAIDEIFKNSFE